MAKTIALSLIKWITLFIFLFSFIYNILNNIWCSFRIHIFLVVLPKFVWSLLVNIKLSPGSRFTWSFYVKCVSSRVKQCFPVLPLWLLQVHTFFFLFVVNSVIHWNEKALGSHVFPIPIPPPTSLSLQVPPHQGNQIWKRHMHPEKRLLIRNYKSR